MKYVLFIFVASIAGSVGLISKDISKNNTKIPVEEIEFLEPIHIVARGYR